MFKDPKWHFCASEFTPPPPHQRSFQLWQTLAHEDAWSHSQIIYFRSSLSQLANFSAMHQQGVISCENIYLSGIVLNHLHGVVQLSIWEVRWFGLGPPAVFESYHSLHTISSYKSMVLAKESSLGASTEFNSLLFCQVTISVCSFERHITQLINLIRSFFSIAFFAPLWSCFIHRHALKGNLQGRCAVSDLSSISSPLSFVLITVYI